MSVMVKKFIMLILALLITINPLLTTMSMAAAFRPVVGDTGGLPGEELAVSSPDGRLYLWNLDRSEVENFPKELKGYAVTTPSLVDIEQNKDEFKDIAVVSKEENSYYLNIFRNNGERISDEFPLKLNFAPSSSPAVFDYDKNGQVEMIIGGNNGKLYIWNDFDPDNIKEADILSVSSSAVSVTLNDIDLDRVPELIVYDSNGQLFTYSFLNGRYHLQDTYSTGHPIDSKPVVYQNESGQSILLLVHYSRNSSYFKEYIWQDGWNIYEGNWANIDGEKVIDFVRGDIYPGEGKEIAVLTAASKIYLFDFSGNLLTGFPRQLEHGVFANGLGVLPAELNDNYQKVFYTFNDMGIKEIGISEISEEENWGERNYHQHKAQLLPDISVVPEPFSPDGDQVKDQALVSYGVNSQKPVNFHLNVSKNNDLIQNLIDEKDYTPYGYSNSIWKGTGYTSGWYDLNFGLNSKGNKDFTYTRDVFLDVDNPEFEVQEIQVKTMEADINAVELVDGQIIISSKQGIEIDYTIDDNYADVPEIVFEITNLDTLEQYLLDIMQPEDKGANSVIWRGQTEEGQFLPDGVYSFKIYARDKAGNKSATIAAVNEINKIKIDRTPPEMIVSTEPVIVTDNQANTTIKYDLKNESSLPVNVTANLISDDEVDIVTELIDKELLSTGLNEYILDTAGLEDGSYKVEFSLTDAANNSTFLAATLVKNRIKTRISSPVEGAVVKNQLEIRGIAGDPDWFNETHFANYQIYFHTGDYQPEVNNVGDLKLSDWIPLPVPVNHQDFEDPLYPFSNVSIKAVTIEDTLAYWDFKDQEIPAGQYTILLYSTEKDADNYVYDTKVIELETDESVTVPELNIKLSESNLILDGDDSDSELEIKYQLMNKESKIELNIVRIKDDGNIGEVVWSYSDSAPEIGVEKSTSWSGTDYSGAYVQSGQYRLTGIAAALDGTGTDKTELNFNVETPLAILLDDEMLSFDPYQNLADGTAQKMSLSYRLSKRSIIKAAIYDLPPAEENSEVIKTLVTGNEQRGNYDYTINWDGSSDQYPNKIVYPGNYYLRIEAESGSQIVEKIIEINLVSSGNSDQVTAELSITGEDRDGNQIIENQGYSDFIYKAEGSGQLTYYPPRDYHVMLTASGKQRVKEFINQDIEVNYRKWYERINFQMRPTIKWLGKDGRDRNEAYRSYSYFGRRIDVAVDENKAWNPQLNRVSWTSPKEKANSLFGQGYYDWKFYDAEFKKPPFKLSGYPQIKAPDGTRIDHLKFFNISEGYSVDDDWLWGNEEARAKLYISFLYNNNGSKKVSMKGTVNKYNPLTLDEDNYGDIYKFDSYLVKALSDFHYGYDSYSVNPIYPVDKELYNRDVNIPEPQFNVYTGEVSFGAITTAAYIYNNDIPWPIPENDDALPVLLEFNDLNQNNRKDNGEALAADYGGEGISEKLVAGRLAYDEEIQFPILNENDGLLNLSSQQRLMEDTVQFAVDIVGEGDKDNIIAEIDDENKELLISYNNELPDIREWNTSYDLLLEDGVISERIRTELPSYNYKQRVSIMGSYPVEKAESEIPTSLAVNTFIKDDQKTRLNDYLQLNNWDINLYYIDGTENHDLVVDNINLDSHTFTTRLINSTTPKRLIPLEGNITGNFAQYSLFYFKKDKNNEPIWHRVILPEKYRGMDGNPYVSVTRVNGTADGIDNDRDGFIDEDGEKGIIGYLDAANLNGVHSIVLQLIDGQGRIKNITYDIQVGKVVLPEENTEVVSSYKLASLNVPAGAVKEDVLISITPTDLNHSDVENVGDIRPLGSIIKLQPSGLKFSSCVDGIDNDEDGEVDEVDEEKRPQLKYRVPYEEYLQMVENTNDLNLYYLNSNGDLEVLDTVVDINQEAGYVEFTALISHFSSFTLMEGVETLLQPDIEEIHSPTRKQFVDLSGKASPGKTLNIYRSSQTGQYTENDNKELLGQISVDDDGVFTYGLSLNEGMNYIYLVYDGFENSPVASFEVEVDLTPPVIGELEQSPEPFSSEENSLSISFSSSETGDMIFNVLDSRGENVYQKEMEVDKDRNIVEWNGKDSNDLLLSDGKYQYQLNIFDPAGNFDPGKSSYQGIITIDNTSPEFSSYQIKSKYLSPNGDGVQDKLISSFTVSEPVYLEIKVCDKNGDIIDYLTESDIPALPFKLKWSGKIEGKLLDEGNYSLIFSAVDKAGNQKMITEKLAVDVTEPIIEDNINQEFYNKELIPEINVQDENLENYKVVLDGKQFYNKTLISEEAEHLLKITAQDLAGNLSIKEKEFVIDRTKPQIDVTGVENNQYYNSAVSLSININDPYLDSKEISLNGEEIRDTEINVEKDGEYRLKILAEDKAKNTAVQIRDFVVDTAAPVIKVQGIEEGKGYKHNLTPEIVIEDNNLSEYQVLLDDLIYDIGTEIKTNGEHLLKVIASDNAGNKTVLSISFIIDKVPPIAPDFLTGKPGDKVVNLDWYDNTEYDLQGYNLYRDGERINDKPIKESNYENSGLINGQTYYYYVTAIDWLGNESKSSNEIEATPGYDIKVTDADLSYNPVPAYAGQEINLSSIIENTGYVPLQNLKIGYYDGKSGEELIKQELIEYLNINEQLKNETVWNSLLGEYGSHYIKVFVDPSNEYREINEADNEAVLKIDLKEPLQFNRNLSGRYPWVLIWSGRDRWSDDDEWRDSRHRRDCNEEIEIHPVLNKISYPKKVVDSEIELLKELRSGKYNILIIPADSRLLGYKLTEEIKQMVYGGKIDLLSFNYSQFYQPVFKDIFGLYYKDNKRVKNIDLQVKDNKFITIDDVKIEEKRINIFGTSKGREIGSMNLDLPGHNRNSRQKVLLKVEQLNIGDSKYQITVKIFSGRRHHGRGSILETEKVSFYGDNLPLEIIDEYHNHNSNINLRILETGNNYITLEIENTSSRELTGINKVELEIKDLNTGELLTYSGNIKYDRVYEGQNLDDFLIEKIEDDYNFPGIVVNDYGKGKAMLFNFDLFNIHNIEDDKTKIIEEILLRLMTVKNEGSPYLIGEYLPVEYTTNNLVLPVSLMLNETPSSESKIYNYGKGEVKSDSIFWYYEMKPDTTDIIRYHLGLPLIEGKYNLNSILNYYHQGQYKYYKNYPVQFNILGDIQIINELEYLLNNYSQNENQQEINKILDKLNKLKYNNEQESLIKYTGYINYIDRMIYKWSQLDIKDRDFVEKVHQQLINLLNIYQHKWYEFIESESL